ncbi:MAG: acyl-CoA dehydrogenase family protein [Polyangiaceae bacterium]|jgi:alkylation response protein AidB-like acyl-CoA dehydrogenase
MSPVEPLQLDRALGDPGSDDGPLGFSWAVRLDEGEEFPTEAAAELERLGVSSRYVPAHVGGALRSFEELACTLRAIARRDVTLAVGHGKTLLGTLPIFLAGDSTLKARVAERVLAGEPIALALTERNNGTDLLSSVTWAEGSSVRSVNGEKWLINNATRATAASVFARTRQQGGPRGFSLLFMDKREAQGAYATLPKIRTHGIRGADISGIRFENAPCSTQPIGGEGAGLSIVLKTFTVTRTLIANVAVGAIDSALRIVVAFARARSLYGGTVLEIPHARAALCSAAADLLACEAVSLAGARMLHSAPEEATFWSSVLKYHVPTTAERLVRDLGVVFGARHYLREGDASGMFQKIQRDIGILSVFDGNTLVNLSNIVLHASALSRGAGEFVSNAARLLVPVDEIDPRRLAIVAHRVHGAEEAARDALAHLSGRNHAEILRPMLEQVVVRAHAIRTKMASFAPRGPFDVTPELVNLASRYARIAAAALSASVFVHSAPRLGGLIAAGDWLVLSLAHELGEGEWSPGAVQGCRERLLEFILHATERRVSFSLLSDCDSGGS